MIIINYDYINCPELNKLCYNSGHLGFLENRNFDRLKLRLERKFLYNIIANKFPYILIFLFFNYFKFNIFKIKFVVTCSELPQFTLLDIRYKKDKKVDILNFISSF